MALRRTIISYLFFPIILLLFGCEKFTGYNYDVEPPDNTVKVSGKIENIYTGESVKDALVQIGAQKTRTDNFGGYLLQFFMGTNEQRDNPVDIVISAPNYETLRTSVVIYPEPTRLNFKLFYAAPIIKQNVIVYNDYRWYCQAIVVDYQGVADIKEVKASFYYIIPHTPKSFFLTFPLQLVKTEDNNTGFFQAIIPSAYQTQYILSIETYTMQATDYEGHVHSLIRNTPKTIPDSFLFDPTN